MVRESCAAVADRPAQIAESFYQHLFELAPSVRGMFAQDMTTQNDRMSQALMDAVRGADNPARIEYVLQEMGARHARHHGAVPEHYPYVGHALVRAVRDLSPRWSTAVGSAWVQVYEWMAAHMVLGAERSAGFTAEDRTTASIPRVSNGHSPDLDAFATVSFGREAAPSAAGLRRRRR
jgi:hemoglobin-like flavoprotein